MAASGSSPGGDIEKVEFSTQRACLTAASVVKKAKPWTWSHIDAVCIKSDKDD